MPKGSRSVVQVLAVDATVRGSGRLDFGDVTVVVEQFPQRALTHARRQLYDLLALANLAPETAGRLAARFGSLPGWGLVPVLYVIPAGLPGIILPAAYRPGRDGFAIGTLSSLSVRERIHQFARHGLADRPPVQAGRYQLDQLAGHLRWPGGGLEVTSREAEILALLFERAGQPVSAWQCAERVLGGSDDSQASLVRRHISNLRRRLEAVDGAPRIAVKQSVGYWVDVGGLPRPASPRSSPRSTRKPTDG